MTDLLFNRVDMLALATASRVGVLQAIGHSQLNCDRHGVYMAKGTRIKTRDVWTKCPECIKIEQDAESARKREIAEAADRQLRERQIEVAAIPVRFIGRTLATFRAETPEQSRALSVAGDFVANWSDVCKKGRWLVFSGSPGTGKSHLAIAILQALMPAHVGRYMTCMELIQTIRATWRKDSEQAETELLDGFGSLPLLVIDEVGVQYGTDSEQNHLFDVLDRRYRNMMPTILLTNQNKDGFRQFVGDRVYDRMTECAKWVPFAWGSYRPVARKEIDEA